MSPITKSQVGAAVSATLAIAEAIRALGSVPSGHLYARVMAHMDIHQYEALLDVLKGAGLIKVKKDVITWTGPNVAPVTKGEES